MISIIEAENALSRAKNNLDDVQFLQSPEGEAFRRRIKIILRDIVCDVSVDRIERRQPGCFIGKPGDIYLIKGCREYANNKIALDP